MVTASARSTIAHFRPSVDGQDWKDAAKNIEMGAWVLGRKRAFLASRMPCFKLTNDDLERASVAAYNAGEGRVLKAIEQGRDPDSCTAHCNYAAAVLRYAELYLNLAIGDVTLLR